MHEHKIWDSNLKEYWRYAPDTKRDGHTVWLLYASQITHLVCPSDANRIIYKHAADLLKNCMLGCKVICVGCINCSYSMARSIMFTGSKIKYRLPPKCMAESFTSTACISKGQKGLFNLMNICIHTFFSQGVHSVLQVGSWMRNLLPPQVKKNIYIWYITHKPVCILFYYRWTCITGVEVGSKHHIATQKIFFMCCVTLFLKYSIIIGNKCQLIWHKNKIIIHSLIPIVVFALQLKKK